MKKQVLAYLTPIGFILSLYINLNNNTKLGTFHLRQSLGLHCFSVILYVASFFIIAVSHDLLHIISTLMAKKLLIFIMSSISIYLILIYRKAIKSANQDEMDLIVFGNSYQKWFYFIK